MRNRAVWRPRPDDPRGGLAWLLREGRATHDALGSLSLAVVGLAAVLFVHGQWLAGCLAVVFAQAPKALEDGVAYLRGVRRLPGTLALVPRSLPVGSLVTLPPPATPFPCRIEVRKNGTSLGSDGGIVTFFEGWLHYEGLRTSFALRPSDVSRREDTVLVLAEGGEVRFEPQDWLQAGDLVERGLAGRFSRELKAWRRSASPPGEPILPPARPHASGVARAGGRLVAGLLGGLPLVLFVLWMSTPAWAALVAFPFVLSALLAIRDLRRLARSAPALPAVE